MNELLLIPKRSLSILVQEVDDEILILDRKDNKIHQLNKVASLIWKKCDGHNSVDDIVELLIIDFDISPEEAKKDVIEMMRVLHEKNLLE
ncbi:MAG: PqqD family protein [Gammaproteobacteria bacterium]|nr:PqqD family protein [Gammaproteobacteria bacterium]MCW8911288.1 PqqD family protein [Gammaproteobacteria bacterium]MCW9004499.1 PqqD family protein [Gammaproteobacteria bacterium]